MGSLGLDACMSYHCIGSILIGESGKHILRTYFCSHDILRALALNEGLSLSPVPLTQSARAQSTRIYHIWAHTQVPLIPPNYEHLSPTYPVAIVVQTRNGSSNGAAEGCRPVSSSFGPLTCACGFPSEGFGALL